MQSFFIAERERFELSNQVSPVTHLAGERLQPARPPLQFLELMLWNLSIFFPKRLAKLHSVIPHSNII